MGVLRYLHATGTERIPDSCILKATTEKPCSQITFPAGRLHVLLQDSCGVDSRLDLGVGGSVLLLAGGAGDRHCPGQGVQCSCKGMKRGGSWKLD